jgi:hypothetical protein
MKKPRTRRRAPSGKARAEVSAARVAEMIEEA